MLGKSGQPRRPTRPGQLPTCPHPPWPKELDPLDSSSKCSSPLQSVPDTPVSSSARFLSPFDFLTTPISAGAEPGASLALGGEQAQGTVLGDRILGVSPRYSISRVCMSPLFPMLLFPLLPPTKRKCPPSLACFWNKCSRSCPGRFKTSSCQSPALPPMELAVAISSLGSIALNPRSQVAGARLQRTVLLARVFLLRGICGPGQPLAPFHISLCLCGLMFCLMAGCGWHLPPAWWSLGELERSSKSFTFPKPEEDEIFQGSCSFPRTSLSRPPRVH